MEREQYSRLRNDILWVMRRITPSFYTIFIIIAIAGISVAIPMVYFSESNTGLVLDEEWTPVVSDTPTQTIAPSITFTPQNSPTFTVSPSPAASANCVYPAEYWELPQQVLIAYIPLSIGKSIQSYGWKC